MPVVILYYDDLKELSGLDRARIIKNIPMMGCDIERVEEDHIDIEFFPNRPDLYSVEGVSRALKGFFGIEKGIREFEVSPSEIRITKDKDIESIRPYLVCAVIRGLEFNSRSIESLMSLQESLHWAVGRNRKKVSIGVHDLEKIKPPFKYIAEDPDFEFIPLDFTKPLTMKQILEKHPKGIKFRHILEKFDKYPLILDSEDNVLSFPPIINSTRTKVTEDTEELFIEVTGIDPAVSIALNIVVASLSERGGKIQSVQIESSSVNFQTPKLLPRVMHFRIDEVEELLGIKLTNEELIFSLEKMRYSASLAGKNINVSIPAYRSDILHTWDLIEDIAIGYGFDKIKPELPSTSSIGKAHAISKLRDSIREIMTGLGYFEVMPFTLTNERMQFDMMRREKTDAITHILYPISQEHTIVRSTLLPNLLEILSINKHNELPQRIFEVGEVVVNGRTEQRLGCAAVHAQANFTEMHAVVDAVMREMCIEYKVAASDDPAFIEGRCADLIIKKPLESFSKCPTFSQTKFKNNKAGVFGEIHPEVILNFRLEHPIISFEMKLL